MAVVDLLLILWWLCVTQPYNTVLAQYCEYKDAASEADLLYCKNLISENDLDEELRSSRRFNVRELVISNSSFRVFLHNCFQGTKFESIRIQYSHILDLSDTTVAFEGLENYLEVFAVENAAFVSSWNWNSLRNLKRLTTIRVISSDLNYASNAFENASRDSLEYLKLASNGMTHIHETAFSKLENLQYLDISHNAITDLKRSMFPNPAKMGNLDFSYNLLQSLPADLFENMPNLVLLRLSGNPLTTLSEATFRSIWPQLVEFDFYDSQLSCDCRLFWLTGFETHPHYTYANCSRPPELKGTSITTIKRKDLWC